MLTQALQLMVYGLMGVFIALSVLYTGVQLLTALFSGRQKKDP